MEMLLSAKPRDKKMGESVSRERPLNTPGIHSMHARAVHLRLIAQALLGEHRNRLRDFAQGARGFARHLHAARGVGRAVRGAIARQALRLNDHLRQRALRRGGLFFGLCFGLGLLLRFGLCLGLREGGRAGGQQAQGGPQERGTGAGGGQKAP